MKVKIASQGVYNGATHIKIGEVFEIDDLSGAALIVSGHAVEVEPEKEEKVAAVKVNPEGEKVADVVTDQVDGQKVGKEDTPEATAANTVAQTKKAIDGQYKRDDLLKAAVDAGVDVKFDAKKSEIIDAIVNQGKAVALLK